jgi:hypothetical protein
MRCSRHRRLLPPTARAPCCLPLSMAAFLVCVHTHRIGHSPRFPSPPSPSSPWPLPPPPFAQPNTARSRQPSPPPPCAQFMDGMLNNLFMEKWERFGQSIWMIHRLFDVVFLVPLVTNALWLKEAPVSALQQTWLPISTLLAMIPCLEEDVRAAYLWYTSYSGPRDNISSLFSTWLSSHLITNKLIGCALTAVGCVALLRGYKPAGITDEMVWGDDNARALAETDAGEDYFPIWIFMASGILLEMNFFFLALVNPDQELGILFITINKMLSQDIAKFMKVFTIIFINYGFAMYICYPRVGDIFLPLNSPEFNSLSAAIQALIELALLGETPALKLGGFEDFTTAQMIEFWVYTLFLLNYLIMALILLLNLLIAMMGDTFATVQEQAVREWRVANCQMMLRLEMLARRFATVNSGEQMGDAWFVLNRTVDAIEEGGGDDDIDIARPDENKAAISIQRKFRARRQKKVGSGGGGGGGGGARRR